METDRLRSFVKVLDCGSITKAAHELRITQPSLSQQISGLEADFCEQLLLRTRLGVTPTEAGIVLYRRAQLILKEVESAHAAVKTSRDSLSGRVSIGLPYATAGSILAVPVFKKLRQLHPGIRLEMREGLCSNLLDALTTGKMDIAILCGNDTAVGISQHRITEESLCYVASRSDPIIVQSNSGVVPIERLNGAALVAPSKRNPIRRLIDEACLRANVLPFVVAEVDFVLTQLSIVKEGLASCVLPERAAQRLLQEEPGLASLLIEPPIRRCISICISDSHPLSDEANAAYRVLLDCATASFQPAA